MTHLISWFLVIMQEVPGCFIHVRAFDVMPVIDQGEKDHKIIAIYADHPEYRHFNNIIVLLPHWSGVGVFNHTDKSFFRVLHDPSADILILEANDIPIKPLNIQTSTGLSWKVGLDIVNGYFSFTKGWKNIADQLFLTEGCILVFDYIRKQTFNMTFYHRNQSCTMGASFFYVHSEPFLDYLEFPHTFSKVNFGKQAPQQPVILFASENQAWSVTVKTVNRKLRFADGWMRVVQEIPLKQGHFVIFTCLDTHTMKVTVYNPNGLQLLLPNFDEPMDVDVKPNVQASQTGTPDQSNVHEEYSFTEKVTRRIRFRKKLEMLSGVAARKHKKVRCAGSQICLLEVDFERNRGYKRYVLRGWPQFLKDHGISYGDFCYFRYVTTEDVLVVSRCEN